MIDCNLTAKNGKKSESVQATVRKPVCKDDYEHRVVATVLKKKKYFSIESFSSIKKTKVIQLIAN